MTRRALVIGINKYQHAKHLSGCVADAQAMAALLEQNKDKTANFDCRSLLDRMEDGSDITRAALRKACRELLEAPKTDVLLYFSGHGALTATGGYLCTSDADKDDWGVPMQEVVDLANKSTANSITIILDCCHGGDIANPSMLQGGSGQNPLAVLREDMTVIAASRDKETAIEAGGHGLFTAAVLDALEGGAADHMGWVTAPSIYAYVERRFGGWGQRPVYKSHSTNVVVIRKCEPLIDRLKLQELVALFPSASHKYHLDPEYEPEDEHGNLHQPVNEGKVRIARLLKQYRDAGLLRATDPVEQLFWTARRSHTVELTARGREYWWLVANKKI